MYRLFLSQTLVKTPLIQVHKFSVISTVPLVKGVNFSLLIGNFLVKQEVEREQEVAAAASSQERKQNQVR